MIKTKLNGIPPYKVNLDKVPGCTPTPLFPWDRVKTTPTSQHVSNTSSYLE